MRKTIFYLLTLLFFVNCSSPKTEEAAPVCAKEEITDERDLPENIPGETMGQKLESLLFWSQDEKERRYRIMHSIYPSIAVESGDNLYALKEGEPITPQWEDDTTLESYMEDNRIGSVIVVQNDEIKLEAHGLGVTQETLWTSYSVAKSVASMLVGAALKDGHIESLDDRLDKYITELEGYGYGEVTVRELLTMTSGMGWNEDYTDPASDVAMMYNAACVGDEAHILSYVKQIERTHEAGERFNYSTGETDLVGILIDKATGMSMAEYLSEKVWKPMGMQQCAYWLADECSNMNIGGSGLSASNRDFARLGLLLLNGGKINGTSILADEWVNDATSMLYEFDDRDGGYGYLLWINDDGTYMAEGIFGQMIYVNPALNLVIAQSAAWQEAGSQELSATRQAFIDAVINALEQ